MIKQIFIRSFLVLALFYSLAQCRKSADVIKGEATANNFHNQAVGYSAAEILSANRPAIVLDINYMPGNKPDSSTLQYFSKFLEAYTNKKSLQIALREIPSQGRDTLSINEINDLERRYRSHYSSSLQTAIFILITDCESGTQNIIGVAYKNTSVALFGRTVKRFSSSFLQIPRWKLETTTLEHEFGHLMGLVDVGSPMQAYHKDPDNPQHCNNSSCLMYYKTETTQLLGRLATAGIPELDRNCVADLRANGGK